ncbi:MAG: hypothetical protein C0605_15140 [Hyphomicrobiales bacterium]|nr:MAG: hypothetical protein C0605_15140 [Hyphomicrobiales bacterium]
MTESGTATLSKCCTAGKWTPMNTLLMILGFILFWPLGLAMLAYILWGDRMEIDKHWQSVKSEFSGYRTPRRHSYSHGTGNSAFDDYRKDTLKRLEEEHRRLKEEEKAFAEFMRDLRRARDKEEFEQFMARKNAPAKS